MRVPYTSVPGVALDVVLFVLGVLWFRFLWPELGQRLRELRDPDARERGASLFILLLSAGILCWMLSRVWLYLIAPWS